MDIKIPVIGNIDSDITKFDFSFVDISIYDIESKEFEDYIEKQQPDFKSYNLSSINRILENRSSQQFNKKYAIVKNTLDDYDYKDVFNVWKILLIIFPSDSKIEYILHFKFEDGGFIRTSLTTFENTYKVNPELLRYTEEKLPEINEFIKRCFAQLDDDNYVSLAIHSYLTGYYVEHIHLEYLTLCMALECVIDGHNELSYRLKRTIALLCGTSITSCEIIFNNVNKLYTLRSKVIHGDNFKPDDIRRFLKPLRALVSLTIFELLVHNVDRGVLNKTITELGYGDKARLSDNYKEYNLNPDRYSNDVFVKRI